MQNDRSLKPITSAARPAVAVHEVPALHESAPDAAGYYQKLFTAARTSKLLIAGSVCISALIGGAYAYFAAPVYQASVLIQIEDQPQPTDRMLGELSRTLDLHGATAPELEVLRSRMVLARAVDELDLSLEAKPKRFPLIGARLAKDEHDLLKPGLFGHGGYAWGAERIVVSDFRVPAAFEGRRFTLTAGHDESYTLIDEDGAMRLAGRVGMPMHWDTNQGGIDLLVRQLHGRAGVDFVLRREARLESIEALQRALKIAERGKQSGVVSVALEGTDAQRTAKVLNEVARQYLRQNEDRKAEGAEKSLAVLDRQLPELKLSLESSEANLNRLRHRLGTIDLGEEAKGLLQLSVTAQTKMMELTQRKQELSARFTEEHPYMLAANQQIRSLNQEMTDVNRRIRNLPAVEQEVVRLSRDVKVNTDVYTSVLATAQQLRLASASRIGNVRLLDAAETPVNPTQPRPGQILAASAAAGLLLGLFAASARKIYTGKVDGPSEVERQFGLTVSVAIPHSAKQRALSAHGLAASDAHMPTLLQHVTPDDNAIESLRRFRTAMQHSLRNCSNNIIVITGPTEGVGKSFVAANLAGVLASVGKKVLLIDADLRTGYLHRSFGVPRELGLAEYLEGSLEGKDAIRRQVLERVDFIPTGALPRDPAELLASENLHRLLLQEGARYDHVIVDTAPVLLVSDALTVAAGAAATFHIVRSGVTTSAEIEEATRQLNQAGAHLAGVVMNDCRMRYPQYGYSNRQYGATSV
ncbi:polysaccharide biosynthesis tyrosine autokinase [Noviherbaspirillum pedocola]|uniref:Polysaccharide biosynthesis tyrosine autokinase n=1 Tax=Noviherbaspirillum pedocola TaxID=2801341 RepID=A0A934W2U4_9BURK|nr:polysaccharide biosynthesis tyrosine autokinase [Noviherbaspirillum pedocola]MBK4736706.1 polysaccharide biosynthesis tyrosine autokinase [Noviherbaspirillum pedocola]